MYYKKQARLEPTGTILLLIVHSNILHIFNISPESIKIYT